MPAPGGEPVRLQLKWHHQFQFAGYYAAEAKGYYGEEGLDVTIVEGDAQHPPIQEVLADRADFGVADADILRAFLAGKPVVVLATIFQHSPYVLLTRADRQLHTPSDLRGKTLMLSDEQGITQLQAMLQREGMSLRDVRIVPHQWNNDLLIHGQVDAISAYSTVEPFQLKARGVEPAIMRAMDYGVDFYGDTLFTTQSELKRHPAQVAAFRRASLRGWHYAMAHPEEIIDLISRMPGVGGRGVTREMLRYEAEAMRPLLGFVEPGYMNPGRWQAIGRTYAELGLVAQPPTEDTLKPFLYVPGPVTHERWLRPLLLGLGALLVLAGGVLLWNLQLRRVVARRTSALQDAEKELLYHVQNSPLGVIEWDHEFRVKRWTGHAEQVFGWRAEEVLGKHPDDWPFVYQEDKTPVRQVLASLLSGTQPRNFHRNRNYRKDGSVVDCEWYNSASLDESGKVKSIFSLVLDVTARTRAEVALRESEENFRAIFEQAAIGMGRVRFSDARWIDANDAFCRMLGYTREEMLSTPWPQLTHPEDVDLDLLPFEKMGRGELNSYTVEKRFIHKDGRWVWARLTLSLARDAQGRPDHEIAIIEDITERKQTEAALERERAFTEALLQACPVGIIAANPGGKILRMNPANQRLWGLAPFSESVDQYREWKGWWADGSGKHGRRLEPHEWALARALRGEICPRDIVEIEPFGAPGTRRIMINSGAPVRGENGAILGAVIAQMDITSLKETEKTLRSSERRLAAVLEALPAGVAIADASGKVTHFNAALTRIWGGPPLPQGTGDYRVWRGWWSDSGKPLAPKDWAMARTLATGKPIEGDIVDIEKFDGSGTATIINAAAPILDPQGRVIGGVVAEIDISRQRQAETEAAELKRKLDAALLAGEIATFEWRIPEDELWGDQNFQRMFGLPQHGDQNADLPAFLERIHPDDRVETRARLQRTLDTGCPYEAEYRIISGDQTRWVVARGRGLRDRTGRVVRFPGVLVDITARKEAEQSLKNSEEQFRALADSVPQLVWRTNREGAVDYVNEQWHKYSGQRLQEALGSGWAAVVHPEDREPAQAAWSAALQSGQVYQIEYRLRREDGVYRWFLGRGVPLKDAGGRIFSWFGTSTDIHEQRRALESLRESEQFLSRTRDQLSRANEDLERRVEERTSELRSTIAELEKMSYSMIHDLRAPLRAIQSFGGIIAEDRENKLTPESRELLEHMRQATERMDHLVRDVLNYSRMVRGDLPVRAVDVGQLVRGIVETYPNLRDAGAELVIAPDFPTVFANPAALTQCLSQLLANAVKFSRGWPGPKIHVRPGDAREGWVRIVVEDNGVGIPPEAQEKIFGLFQRLKNTGGGTGMGLAIVKKAVERMGGHVGVESQPGQGSRFWVELPAAETLSDESHSIAE